jgi:hypothetical protein
VLVSFRKPDDSEAAQSAARARLHDLAAADAAGHQRSGSASRRLELKGLPEVRPRDDVDDASDGPRPAAAAAADF